MKTLIIGARGLIGSALSRQIPNAICGIPVETHKKNFVYLDITKYETLFKVFSLLRPDVVYLTAAIAHVDRCEQSKGTDVVNINGTKTVLSLCDAFGSKLVWFSSSYVFDGNKRGAYREMDETCPINYYGEQKRIIEESIAVSGVSHIVIRTVGVYGTERLKKNFAKQVISNTFAGRNVYAPSDQYMNPILSDDLAKVTVHLVDKGFKGLIHVSGNECISKYDFAKRVAENFGMQELVLAVKTSDMSQRAKRPKNGCLDCSYLESLGIQIPSFRGGLARFMSMAYNG